MRFIITLLILGITLPVFSNDTLVVGYSNSAPFIFKDGKKLQGPISWLWENVADENDFYCIYKEIPSDELLNKLKEHEIDVSLYPLTITSERSAYMDFSVPYFLAHSGIATKEFSSWQEFVFFIRSFFSFNFFKALATLALVLLVFGFFTWRFERKENEEEFGSGIRGLWSGFWWAAVTMTTVGYGDKAPKTSGGRLVGLIWMFTAVIIISGLTASIASSLTVTELETSSSSITDFKGRNLGTVNHSSTHQWLRDNFYTNTELYSTKEQLVGKLKSGEVEAIAYDIPLLRNLIKNDTTNGEDVRILPLEFNSQYYAFGLSRELNDTLKNKINTRILEHTESLEWNVVLAEYDLGKN